KGLGLDQVSREYGGREALRDIVLFGDRHFEPLVAQAIEDWGERLVFYEVGLAVEFNKRGRHVKSCGIFLVPHPRAPPDSGARSSGVIKGLLHSLVGLAINQRSHKRLLISWVADRHRAIHLAKAWNELVVN